MSPPYELYDLQWTRTVSRQALATLQEAKWNRTDGDSLPVAADIQHMHSYLFSETVRSARELKEEPSPENAHRSFNLRDQNSSLCFSSLCKAKSEKIITEGPPSRPSLDMTYLQARSQWATGLASSSGQLTEHELDQLLTGHGAAVWASPVHRQH